MREARLILFSPPFVRCLTLLLGSFIKVSTSYYISFTSPAFYFSHFFPVYVYRKIPKEGRVYFRNLTECVCDVFPQRSLSMDTMPSPLSVPVWRVLLVCVLTGLQCIRNATENNN